MILFWVICAFLIIVALAFVLPPLLQNFSEDKGESEQERKQANIAIYRDQLSELESDLRNGLVSQQQYEQDRDEIERRLLEDVKLSEGDNPVPAVAGSRSTVYVLALGLPLVAILFYMKVGDIKGIGAAAAAQSQGQQTSGTGMEDPSQQRIEANMQALAKRLESNPSDGQGWITLARSYSSLERYPEAANAYARATAVITNDADVWAEYAFAYAMANGRQLQGKSMEFIDRALKIDPNNLKALELAGSAAFQNKDYKKAIDYWQRVLSKVQSNSEVAQSINSRINEAKSLLNSK